MRRNKMSCNGDRLRARIEAGLSEGDSTSLRDVRATYIGNRQVRIERIASVNGKTVCTLRAIADDEATLDGMLSSIGILAARGHEVGTPNVAW